MASSLSDETNEKSDSGRAEPPEVQSPAASQHGSTLEPNDTELKPALGELEASPAASQPKPKRRLSRNKKIALAAGAIAVLVLTVLFAVPLTRYAILGTVFKRDVTVTLQDSKTTRPVSEATVSLAGKSATTDAQGKATIKSVPVGAKAVTVKKKFYKDATGSVLVPLTGGKTTYQLSIVATGRQVPVKVINKISQQPVEGAQIAAAGTSAKTDKNGEAIIVLPANVSTQDATLTLSGYNQTHATIQITEQKDAKNTIQLVPGGTLYFLSKRSGTIDVMRSDLDGGNAQTVLKGTGKEDDSDTVLLASRDWKYLALESRRDSDKAKLYVIDTAARDKLTTVDEGDATFSAVGWYNNYFVYTLNRPSVPLWQPKQNALKSYNATTGQLATLDETDAIGTSQDSYAQEVFGDTYILDNLLVFTKHWYGDSALVAGKHISIMTVQPGGQGKQTLKDFDNANKNISTKLYKPQALYFQVDDYTDSNKTAFYEFEDGTVQAATITRDDFAKFYPTFLLSPSGHKTFWYEPRDGKNTLFIGDANAGSGKQVTSLSEYTPYGWYGEDYLLVSKGGSELYIMSLANPTAPPVKVTDYHKPQTSFASYGYGYGGL